MNKVKRILTDKRIIRLIELWIKASIWDGEKIEMAKKGIPQGSPISPVLANLFLDELDEKVMKQGYKYVRYADDFLVLCKKPESASKALELTENILEELSLKLDEADIRHFDQGFRFLGFSFVRSVILKSKKQRTPNKILHFPAPMNLKSFLEKGK